jgi:hypothetical protein
LVLAARTSNGQGLAMKDLQAHLETLLAQIAECERFQREAKSQVRRDLFGRLVARYKVLAAELERAIAEDRDEKE